MDTLEKIANGLRVPISSLYTEDFRDYVFVPFMRENDDSAAAVQGTGLGMSIAQGIVNAMNGSIQVETQKNRGSRFTVTLSMELDGEEHMAGDPGHGAVSGFCARYPKRPSACWWPRTMN